MQDCLMDLVNAIKKMTGKTPTENIKSFLDKGKILQVKEKRNSGKFFVIVKNKIEKTKVNIKSS